MYCHVWNYVKNIPYIFVFSNFWRLDLFFGSTIQNSFSEDLSLWRVDQSYGLLNRVIKRNYLRDFPWPVIKWYDAPGSGTPLSWSLKTTYLFPFFPGLRASLQFVLSDTPNLRDWCVPSLLSPRVSSTTEGPDVQVTHIFSFWPLRRISEV